MNCAGDETCFPAASSQVVPLTLVVDEVVVHVRRNDEGVLAQSQLPSDLHEPPSSDAVDDVRDGLVADPAAAFQVGGGDERSDDGAPVRAVGSLSEDPALPGVERVDRRAVPLPEVAPVGLVRLLQLGDGNRGRPPLHGRVLRGGREESGEGGKGEGGKGEERLREREREREKGTDCAERVRKKRKKWWERGVR